ncbi:MAG TPA: hypothetical protein VNO17_08775 [Actinomycetota bacterium]|nr:hypothetical protein [Actinomycetota bacterium]
MFVRYFSEIPLPLERVEAALLEDPHAWLPGVAQRAEDRSRRLLAEVGFGEAFRIDKQVEISLGEVLRRNGTTLLPMSWKVTGAESLFPKLEADIEVAALGPGRTQLAMSARYTPPLGALGRAIDRALLHRVAEATIKDFLDRAAESLVTLAMAGA